MTDMKKGRPRHSGDLPSNNDHTHRTSVTAGQATADMARLTDFWERYDEIMTAAASSEGVRYPSPGKGYVVTFVDGDSEPVAGFDRAGHPLIEDARYGLVRADAIPTYVTQGWVDLMRWSA